ncbi:unnamed protein product [Caenorhabditis sp. 36 PRJEB53466]|nr:unnamed protein product [Caenorhabditis sp. 36 PRJEB53466]
MRLYILLAISAVSVSALANKKARQTTEDEVGDDYSDFSSQSVKNAGANHELKQVTYSTIAPKFDIPTRTPLLNPNPIGQNRVQATTKKPVVVDYRRGYYFQHYPWDRLPRRYLLRPGMTYVYPPQYQYANYRYPYLPSTYIDPYNIYRSHPGIGYGCGQSGCGGGYPQGYGGYSSGCGGGSGSGCGSFDDDEDEDSYEDEDEEGGKSGEAKINKKDPLEDLELEDLEKLSKSTDEGKSTSSGAADDLDDVEPTPIKKTSVKASDDEDLIDDRKKAKRNFLIKWA